MMTDIWDKKPAGTKYYLGEEFDKWLYEMKAEYDDAKADAEIARMMVGFEAEKEGLRDKSEKGSHIIVFKEYFDEKIEKAKKWDRVKRDPYSKIVLSEVFDEINQEKEKLESLKEFFKARARHAKLDVYRGHWPFGRAHIDRWKKKLEEALGDEDR